MLSDRDFAEQSKFVYMKQNAEELPKLITFVKRLNRKYNNNISAFWIFIILKKMMLSGGSSGRAE